MRLQGLCTQKLKRKFKRIKSRVPKQKAKDSGAMDSRHLKKT